MDTRHLDDAAQEFFSEIFRAGRYGESQISHYFNIVGLTIDAFIK